jgi:site-specific DNA-adenine methylase
MQKLQLNGPLQSLFPYPGGKAQVAPIIWAHFGTIRNYLEPFAGSLAVLLARPDRPRVETVSDADGHLVNFFRSIVADPDTVVRYARWPVTSVDLWARHDALCAQRDALTAQLIADYRFCDPVLAGLWLYAVSTWTGSGFAQKAGGRSHPHVSHTGSGIHALKRRGKLAQLCAQLQLRLQDVRFLCGEWRRLLTKTQLFGVGGITGILLDPPYTLERRDQAFYATPGACAPAVRDWAVAHGNDPRLRIALCGLADEYEMPDDWVAHHWQARGGLANTKASGRGSGTTRSEVLWFSPFCSRQIDQPLLLA